MNVQYVSIEDIRPYEKNPRKNDEAVEYVANSIREFGWKQPIVVDADGVIIAGHTRYKAAKKLNMKEVPVLVADDLTDEQVKAYRLADNKTGEIAEWDYPLVDEILAEISDIDMSEFGFCEATIPVKDDEFEIIVPDEPRTIPGDLYLLRNHRVMCGDSTNAKDVQKLMAGKQADLLLTDPPYNVGYEGTNGKKIQNDDMGEDEFYSFLLSAFSIAEGCMRKGAAFYIWHADTNTVVFRNACEKSGLHIRQVLIWAKNHFVLGRQDYQWMHEPCLYGWKAGQSHYWGADRRQTTILEFDKPLRNAEHPTMKPIEMMDYLIQNSTRKGEIVLDLFGGSGSTLVACEQDNRVCYMMERDPRYVDVIIDRWEVLTGHKAVRL